MSTGSTSDEPAMQPPAYEPSHFAANSPAFDPDLMIKLSDLVGAAKIAEKLGFTHPQSIHTLRRRCPDFPAPVASLRRAHLWNWVAVERWARETGRII